MKRFLITGINGFIGSNLAERLIKDGHRVNGLIRKSSDLKFLKGLELELFFGDVTDKQSLVEPLKDVDIVVHVAALASDWGSYDSFYKANVFGTQNIAEEASNSGVKRFVHISSTVVHGFPNCKNINEDFPLVKSIFPYCDTKRIAEEWLFEFAKKTQMEITAIRAGNVFGVKDRTFAEKYCDALMQGKGGYIDGGRHWTNTLYIDNLIDAIVLASFEPNAVGEAFIITDGNEITWKEVTYKYADTLGIKRPTLSTPFWLGYSIAFILEMIYKLFQSKNPPILTRYRISNGGTDYHFSIEKAKKLLNYKPKVGLDEGIKRTIAWYKNRANQ